jgi:hypothetical protein
MEEPYGCDLYYTVMWVVSKSEEVVQGTKHSVC